MEFSTLQPYVLPIAVVVFFAWRILKFQAIRKKLPVLLAQGAVIVDVRRPGEFAGGANPASLNLPLDSLDREADRLDRQKPVIVCCASGGRSAMAAALLKRKGFGSVVNAGSWRNTLV